MPGVTTHPSVCPLDCPDRCSLAVTVEDGRVTEIDAGPLNPATDGYICGKVRNFARRQYGPDRLLHPMRRTGPKGSGQFERIGWDEAIATIAIQLDAARHDSGGESILPFYYGGSNGLLTQDTADARLFRSLGASRLARTVCAAPTGAATKAMYGKMATVDFADFEEARFILIWGANPRESNIHLVPRLKAARARGARIALVAPRRTLAEGIVDLHLPVYPGTDGPVALAMVAHLERQGAVDRAFLAENATGAERLLEAARTWTLERAADVARVEPAAIAALAEAYAAADPALLRCGWGLERNRNGEAAVAAVLALPAVAGKFGRRGGGYALSNSSAYQVDDERLAGVPAKPTRVVNMNLLGRTLLEEKAPPIKALFVYNANPVATVPDQHRIIEGMKREDLFTVVFEQVMTDTAPYADILLPATTFLEHTELSTSYGAYGVTLSGPVIPAEGEARSNEAVFTAIGDALGIAESWPRGEAQIAAALAAIGGPLAEKDPAERLRIVRGGGRLTFDFPGERPVQFKTAFPRTDDGKVHLWPAELGDDPYLFLPDPGDAQHPLALISPATGRTISSSLAEYGFTEAFLEMHPDDAAARSLADGDTARVHNALGEVIVRVHLSRTIRRGVASLPKGIWNRHTKNGVVGNALVPDAISRVSGGACFNDARVEVARA